MTPEGKKAQMFQLLLPKALLADGLFSSSGGVFQICSLFSVLCVQFTRRPARPPHPMKFRKALNNHNLIFL